MKRPRYLFLAAILIVGCYFLFSCTTYGQYNDVLAANRSSGSFSAINIRNHNVTTYNLPTANNASEPMYMSYSPSNELVYIGDRGNNRLVIYNANDYAAPLGEVAVGAGIFHQWADPGHNQMWVNNDIDNTISVVNLSGSNVITTIAAPADLVALGGKPHDVIIDPVSPFAYVTMLGVSGNNDYVIKYSTNTFQEVDRIAVGNDPHVSLSATNNKLYVPTQGGSTVHVINRDTFNQIAAIVVPNSHGAFMSQDGGTFFTTNIANGGVDGLVSIDTLTNTINGTVDTPFSVPHNVVLDPKESLLFLSHSGATNDMVSIFDVSDLENPVFLTSVQTEFNPYGLLVVSNIPEPASGLLLFGIGSLFCTSRRRR